MRENNKKNKVLCGLFIISIFLIIHSVAVLAQSLPALSKVNELIKADFPQCKLLQLKDLDNGLRKYFIANHPSAQPGYIIADFDGNGKEDYAVLLLCGEGKGQTLQFAVFMADKNNSYSCVKINKWSKELYLKNLYLEIVKPGKIKETERVIKIKNDGVSLNLYEAASQVYYWKNGKFNYIQTSD